MKKNVFYNRLYTIVITLCMILTMITIINVTAASPPVVDGVISPGEYDDALYIQLEGPWPSPSSPYSGPVDGYLYWDSQYLWIAVDEPVPNWGSGGSFIEFMWDAGIHGTMPYYHAWVLFSDGNWQYVRCGKPVGCWGWAADPFPGTSWWATGSATEFKFDYTLYGTLPGDTIKLVVDTSDTSYGGTFGDCQIWPYVSPSNPLYYPCETASSVATWGSIVLNGNQPPTADAGGPYSGLVGDGIVLDGSGSNDIDGTIVSYEWDLDNDGLYDDATGIITTHSWSSDGTYPISLKVTDNEGAFDTDDTTVNIGDHAVDGVISPGEYDGGMAVTLIDGGFTVAGYIDWDDQYLYVAVDEPNPGYVEFTFDAGSHRSFFDVFTIFSSGSTNHMISLKPPIQPWSPAPYIFTAENGVATELKVDYTLAGIALGDTIKMCIERGSSPNAYWPEDGIIWTGTGRGPEPSTWGDVTLSSPPGNILVFIDIKPGSCPNSININSKGIVPVAILTDEDFDAANVDCSTIMFLDANPVHSTLEDVDYDGDIDMILQFKTQELDFSLVVDEGGEYPYAYLNGETFSVIIIQGKDTVRLIGQHNLFQQFFLQKLIQRFPIFEKILNQII